MKVRGWHSKDDALDASEREHLFKAAGTPFEKLLLMLLGWLGLRIGEVAHLHRDWISFQQSTIKIPSSWRCSCADCVRAGRSYWKPKYPTSARTIPFDWLPDGGELIRRWFMVHDDVGKSHRQISRILKQIADRAGISKRVYPHALRATAALCLAEKGASAQALCNLLGWSQLGTADAYIRRAGFGLKQELERIGQTS